MGCFEPAIANQDLPYLVGKPDRDRKSVAGPACIVVQFGQTHDVLGDLLDIGITVLDIKAERYRDLGAPIGPDSRLKTGAPKKSPRLIEPP